MVDVAPNFWPVIAAANRDDGKLRAQLAALSRDELIRFYRDYIELAGVLREPPYARPGASDDASEDISWWVVAQGEAVYRRILGDPAQTPHALPKDRAGLGFMSQIGNVFHERFGEELTEVDLGQV
jgi:hypothetical protein